MKKPFRTSLSLILSLVLAASPAAFAEELAFTDAAYEEAILYEEDEAEVIEEETISFEENDAEEAVVEETIEETIEEVPAEVVEEAEDLFNDGSEAIEEETELLNATTAQSGSCGTSVTYTLDTDGVLTITGTGAMKDYLNGTSPFFGKSISSITIGSGVTAIGEYAFAGCKVLTSVSIPSTVTTIGEYAFMNCTILTMIKIPNSVTSMGKGIFYGCSSLSQVTMSSGLTTIPAYAFEHSSIVNLNLPSSITTIESQAFEDCDSLLKINWPSSLKTIGFAAFNNCDSLASISLPKGLTTIEGSAFSNCPKLSSVSIPTSVTSIGSGAFSNCGSLKTVTVPSSVTSFGITVFPKETTIKAYAGSAALDYATQNGNPYSLLIDSVSGFSGTQSALGKVKLKWKAVSGVTGYKIQYSTSSSFSNPKNVNINAGTTTTKTVTVVNGGTYYFRIRALLNQDGQTYTSSWSKMNFNILVAPSKVKDFTAKVGASKNIKFTWTPQAGVTGYQVQISVDSSMPNDSTLTKSQKTKNSSASIQNLQSLTYYVRIRAYTKLGSTTTNGAWSAVQSVVVS